MMSLYAVVSVVTSSDVGSSLEDRILQFATCSKICLLVNVNVVSQPRQPQNIGVLSDIRGSGSGIDVAVDSALMLLYIM